MIQNLPARPTENDPEWLATKNEIELASYWS